MKDTERLNGESIYVIRLTGRLSPDWSEWFDGMAITVTGQEEGDPNTLLVGLVKDQAALRSLLGRIWNLNLTILSIKQLEPGTIPNQDCPWQRNTVGGTHGDSSSRNK